jgi:hypothetical protein
MPATSTDIPHTHAYDIHRHTCVLPLLPQVDVALEGTDPQAVGLAKRTTAAGTSSSGRGSRQGGSKEPKRTGARREWKAASKAGDSKGFSSSVGSSSKDAGSQ